MKKKFWKIEGYDSTLKIYEVEVPFHCFQGRLIENLLQALVAKTGLEFDEIVGAYACCRSEIANDMLSIHREFSNNYVTLMCGSNPYFVARVIHKES